MYSIQHNLPKYHKFLDIYPVAALYINMVAINMWAAKFRDADPVKAHFLLPKLQQAKYIHIHIDILYRILYHIDEY